MPLRDIEAMYDGDDYYWGREPNEFASVALEHAPERDGLRVVDIGAGEGRDAVHFAAAGHDVLAIDVSANALRKARRLAADRGVDLDCLRADVDSLALDVPIDLCYSIGTLQYLSPDRRETQFAHLQDRTRPGGVHALFAFVDHPDVPPAPDWRPEEETYDPGELESYYADWEVAYEHAFVFDDDSAGEPHQHACEEYVFRKPASSADDSAHSVD